MGIQAPAWLQGTSILPLVRGETDEVRDAIFAEVNYHCCYEPQRTVRTDRWKYIHRCDDVKRWAMPNCDDSISKTFMMEQGWRDLPTETHRLYDMVFDPAEANNLAGNPAYWDVLVEMRSRLEAWRAETDDPVTFEGCIMDIPETAVLNLPWDLSPGDFRYPADEVLYPESRPEGY